MINQSLDMLLKNIENRYCLVVAVSKRARTLGIDKNGEMTCSYDEALTRAVEEISADKIRIKK